MSLIETDAFAEVLEDILLRYTEANYLPISNMAKNMINDAMTAVYLTPKVEAEPVRHGKWIPVIDEPTALRHHAMLVGYTCSLCGRYEEKEEPYCHCGAKMG